LRWAAVPQPVDLSGFRDDQDALEQAKAVAQPVVDLLRPYVQDLPKDAPVYADSERPIASVGGTALGAIELFLISAVVRGVGLHSGIVNGIERHNPHAVFTLMRSLLELVANASWVRLHEDYVEVLMTADRDLQPGRTRHSSQKLLNAAAEDYPGVKHAWAELSDLAHYGALAFVMPFRLTDEVERLAEVSTRPEWQRPRHHQVACAQAIELMTALRAILGDIAAAHPPRTFNG
jgi:hypothetical protein